MGRSIAFDYNEAIHRATLLFWRRGYNNASMRNLLKVMRIGEGSFYNTVKSKKRLYLECLKHYEDTVGKKRAAALFSQDNVKLGIRALFKTVLDDLENPDVPRLCLMANSVSYDVLKEKELRQFVEAEMAAFKLHLVRRFEAAIQAGELPKNFQPEAVVGIIATYMQGLLRTVLISYNRKQLDREMEVLLRGLGL
jgi:TetR/AcrR family transcriptional regulator, transcriptional repressor for nem operon